MYYSDILLVKNGKFACLWLAATSPKSAFRKKKLWKDVDLIDLCLSVKDIVLNDCRSISGIRNPRMSLYMSIQLCLGIARIFKWQREAVLKEVEQWVREARKREARDEGDRLTKKRAVDMPPVNLEDLDRLMVLQQPREALMEAGAEGGVLPFTARRADITLQEVEDGAVLAPPDLMIPVNDLFGEDVIGDAMEEAFAEAGMPMIWRQLDEVEGALSAAVFPAPEPLPPAPAVEAVEEAAPMPPVEMEEEEELPHPPPPPIFPQPMDVEEEGGQQEPPRQRRGLDSVMPPPPPPSPPRQPPAPRRPRGAPRAPRVPRDPNTVPPAHLQYPDILGRFVNVMDFVEMFHPREALLPYVEAPQHIFRVADEGVEAVSIEEEEEEAGGVPPPPPPPPPPPAAAAAEMPPREGEVIIEVEDTEEMEVEAGRPEDGQPSERPLDLLGAGDDQTAPTIEISAGPTERIPEEVGAAAPEAVEEMRLPVAEPTDREMAESPRGAIPVPPPTPQSVIQEVLVGELRRKMKKRVIKKLTETFEAGEDVLEFAMICPIGGVSKMEAAIAFNILLDLCNASLIHLDQPVPSGPIYIMPGLLFATLTDILTPSPNTRN